MGGVIAGWPVLSYNASGPFSIDTGLVAGCLQVGDALLEVRVIENPRGAVFGGFEEEVVTFSLSG